MSGYLPADRWPELARAIVLTEQAGSIGTAHLLRALAAGRIALMTLLPERSAGTFKAFVRLATDRPTVMLIGDDDGLDRGPNGWPLAHRAVTWARKILLHGAGAELFHYEPAIVAAELTHRSLIIECSTATVDVWASFVRAAPHRPSTLIIRPADGPHPLPVRREAMH